MPIRRDIRKVLVIGSGPIVIGQACEFDYSGTQACRALREANLKVVLLNSNPATIMTDAQMADRTYIEPMTAMSLERIALREKVDAILPTMGGQTALNLVAALDDRGFFRRHRVAVIGASVASIRKAEDRNLFKRAMRNIGLDLPASGMASSPAQAQRVAARLGFPVVLRPSFTLGGTGAAVAKTPDELAVLAARAISASPVGEILVEESVIGWKEFELEVIRDSADNVIVVCSVENVDPMGVHTGDSVTVAPAQTLSDELFQELRDSAKKIVREIGVDTGGANIQFAVHPKSGRVRVIEMNPRVSRSSALASKATGYPIAKVATKLALGLTLDEIKNDVTGTTPASFEPSMDYVVTKIPRFAFEKFRHADETLDTQMKSVGETMAIGRNFKESLQKAVRGLEIGRAGLGADGRGMEPAVLDAIRSGGKSVRFRRMVRLLRYKTAVPNCDRLFAVKYALMMGQRPAALARLSGIDPWFIDHLSQMVDFEIRLRRSSSSEDIRKGKVWGYSDEQIAYLRNQAAAQVRTRRRRLRMVPAYSPVDTCAGEFDSITPYFYSTYAASAAKYEPIATPPRRGPPKARRPVVILGGGPNRIGQGIEFDYCCVHAAMTLKELGRKVVMVNSNPETVSTDPDISDRLYFEPVTTEDVLNIVDRERADGVIVQFGGQTPINLCSDLARSGVRILGTSPKNIDRAEDRKKFDDVLRAAGLFRPEGGTAIDARGAMRVAARIGFPVLVRPSYVLGGLGMQIIYDSTGLEKYLAGHGRRRERRVERDRDVGRRPRSTAGHGWRSAAGVEISAEKPLLIDRYLRDAVEVDVDAVSDGRDTAVVGILEHVEEAGVHSGDSACFYPPTRLDRRTMEEIRDATAHLAAKLNVVGLINVQFAIQAGRVSASASGVGRAPSAGCARVSGSAALRPQVPTSPTSAGAGRLYVLEVNPRASRTVPFVSKTSGVPLVSIAVRVMLGARLRNLIDPGRFYFPNRICVKECVLPFLRFSNTDVGLGPQMMSTGEVMGVDRDPGMAFAKSQEAAGFALPMRGRALISVQDADKPAFVEIARDLAGMGFSILATPNTGAHLARHGIRAVLIPRETARVTLLKMISAGKIQMLMNTFRSTAGQTDAKEIRRAALIAGVPILTTASAAHFAVRAIRALRSGRTEYSCLQEWTRK